MKKSETRKLETCESCSNSTFLTLPDSVLYRQYSFINKKNLVACSECGEKYLLCSHCGSLLTPVRISMSIFGIKTHCQSCGSEDREISAWVEKNSNL